MTPKRRKPSKAILKEEETEIALDLSQDLETETEELTADKLEKEQEKTKASKSDRIKKNIDEVKRKEGVIGYILRNAKSASIDLNDPARIIDYAVLSSSAFEASEELSKTFDLGEAKQVLVEGSTAKFLSFALEDNKISVFMEKTVDHKRLYKDLSR